MGKWHSGLRARLMALVVLALVPAAAMLLYNASVEHGELLSAQRRDNAQLVRLVAMQQVRLIEGARQLLVVLSRIPMVRGAGRGDCGRFLAEVVVQYPWFSILGVAAPDGNLLCDSRGKPGNNIADRPYFQRALQTRGFVIGEYQIGRNTGHPSFSLAQAIIDARGAVESVIVASVRTDEFRRLEEGILLPPNAVLLIADRDGTVLSRHPAAPALIGTRVPDGPLREALLRGDTGSVESAGLDGIVRMYSYTTLTGTSEPGLFTAVGMSRDDILAASTRELWGNLLGLGFVLILSLAAAWIGSRGLVLKHLWRLRDTARMLSTGQLDARSGIARAPAEVAELAGAFDHMATALQARHAATALLAARLLQTQEAERHSVARELHDEVCQALAAIRMNLQSVQNRLAEPGIAEAMLIADATLQRVRALSATLRPPQLTELGLEAALQAFAEYQSAATEVEIVVRGNIGAVRPPADLEVTCFRTVQEAVESAIRYAAARKVWIDLAACEGDIRLTISDDGRDLDLTASDGAPAVRDMALGALAERVRLAGGHVDIDRSTELGTEIRATFSVATSKAFSRWNSGYPR